MSNQYTNSYIVINEELPEKFLKKHKLKSLQHFAFLIFLKDYSTNIGTFNLCLSDLKIHCTFKEYFGKENVKVKFTIDGKSFFINTEELIIFIDYLKLSKEKKILNTRYPITIYEYNGKLMFNYQNFYSLISRNEI